MDFLLNVSKSYKALRSKCSVFTKIPIWGNEPKNTEQHSDLDMLNILRQLVRANARFGVFINIILNAAINYAKRSVRFLKEPTTCIYSHFKWHNYEEIGIITVYDIHRWNLVIKSREVKLWAVYAVSNIFSSRRILNRSK